MKKTSAERKIIAGFVVLAVALAGVAWLSSQTLRSSVAQQQWVTHTYQVMESLQRGRLLLVKAQTDQRNYLFTGDTNFEKASDDDRASATAWLKQLGHWIQDNRGQQQRLNDLKPLVSQWLSFVTQQTTLPPRRGWISEDATATEQGANLFQGISLRLTQMESVETRLLQERQQRLDTDAELTGTFIVAAAVLAVALGWVSLIFIHRDLDERRRTEKALRQSEERARLTVQIIRDYAIFMLDAGGRVASWNIGAERIKGYKTEEIVGKHFSIFYPEAIARRGIPEKALQQARDEGRCEHEGWRVRKNGSRFWAHAVITAMRHEDGSLIGFAKVTRDLTEQKRAEAVREERDRFFELSRDMMCVAGFDGWFKSVNPAWEQTLGFSREELLDKPFIEFVHPDDRAVTHIETQKMMAGGETIRMENRCLCRDGAWRRFAWSARPDMERQLIYGTARDITEEAKVQAQILTLNESLQRHSRQLEAANKELEAFSYSVSHDLRAPLRHIGGFVRLLNKQVNGNMDEASRRYLDIIADAAQRMGALIDDLLIFSRM
ncbi:MAG: PAS domain S-box protein, partial [Verrucomicrobia bacterium]|nr:PAS domain S-box protein [Verrucomicrobiota bacterium]